MNWTKRFFLAAALAALPLPASALCTLICWCSVSTDSVAFGVVSPVLAAPHDTTGNVRFTCGGVLLLLVPYEIKLGAGQHGTGFSPRKMLGDTGDLLDYNLFLDDPRQTVWTDQSGGTVGGTITIEILGGSTHVHPVYGRIFGGQGTKRPGLYGDTVVVTVTYS